MCQNSSDKEGQVKDLGGKNSGKGRATFISSDRTFPSCARSVKQALLQLRTCKTTHLLGATSS